MAEKKDFSVVYICYYYSEHRKELVCATEVGNCALKRPQRPSGLGEDGEAGCEGLSLETFAALSWKAVGLILSESWGKAHSTLLCCGIRGGEYRKSGFAADRAVAIVPASLWGGGDHATPMSLQWQGGGRILWHLHPKSCFPPQLLRAVMSKQDLVGSYYARPQEGEQDNEGTVWIITRPASLFSFIKSVRSSSFLGSSK